jgi:DNA polymerase type B, organellar and viral
MSSALERQNDLADFELDHPFFFWDGEAPQDAGYALFGNDAGYEICHPFLSTIECLDLILECGQENPQGIHVGFAFDYDVNMILADLPWNCLNSLHVEGACDWKGYRIEHIPGKWFQIQESGIRVRIYDVFSFFHCSYIAALEKYDIGTSEQRDFIAAGKDQRSIFLWKDIDYIRNYWLAEGAMGPILMDELRRRFADAGYPIRSWHGPGALARYAIRQHRVRDCMASTPLPVWLAARYAYTGGRFHQFLAGYHDGPVYSADLNSAYPFACAMLPNLATGRWRYEKGRIPRHDNRFEYTLYHIRYSKTRHQAFLEGPQPLFRRFNDGRVDWPPLTESWYWGPEAWNVRNDPSAEFLEAWVFEGDGTRPFSWINDAYERRMFLKSIGHPAELGIKLMLNAMTGQFAQRVGWRKQGEAPATHQIEWAGFITSVCKSLVWEVAKSVWERDGLISIDTDGVFSRVPFVESDLPGGISKTELGLWEVTEYSGILSWQNGIYWPRNMAGEWGSPKSRGAPRGKIKIQHAWRALKKWKPIEYDSTQFIGYGQALNGQFPKWRTWVKQRRKIAFGGDVQSKMYHADRHRTPSWNMCRKCYQRKKRDVYSPGMHDLIPAWTSPPADDADNVIMSKMHYLPWVDAGEPPPWDEDIILDFVYEDDL